MLCSNFDPSIGMNMCTKFSLHSSLWITDDGQTDYVIMAKICDIFSIHGCIVIFLHFSNSKVV